MAYVLPHAGFNQPPLNKAAPSMKVPVVSVPLKPGPASSQGHPAVTKPQFQKLLDQAKAGKTDTETPEKLKVPKAKTVETKAEKVKETKKTEVKETKAEAYEAVLASILPVQAKIDTVSRAKTSETETVQAAMEKARSPLKNRRSGSELGVPAPATAASAEIARLQAQQKGAKTDRTDERPKVFVVDRRTEAKEKEKLKLPGAEAAAQQPVNAAAELQAQQTKFADSKTAAVEAQVTFQAVAGKAKDAFDLKSQNTPVSPRDAATFQQYLVDKGYGQLVDQARIVLRDQNAGEIRMTLYPQTLGKVKINLNLSDSSLAGQIFVENQTVKDVFQSNMEGLMQAFRDGGYSDLSLQVSVGNGNGGGQAGDRQPQTAAQARDYDRQVDQIGPVEGRTDRIGSWNDRQINLTA